MMKKKVMCKRVLWSIVFAVAFIIVGMVDVAFVVGGREIDYTRSNNWSEDFETGYDGWEYFDGDLTNYGVQTAIVYEGNYAFKMTGSIDTDGSYAGNFKYNLNIYVDKNTLFIVCILFPGFVKIRHLLMLDCTFL